MAVTYKKLWEPLIDKDIQFTYKAKKSKNLSQSLKKYLKN